MEKAHAFADVELGLPEQLLVGLGGQQLRQAVQFGVEGMPKGLAKEAALGVMRE